MGDGAVCMFIKIARGIEFFLEPFICKLMNNSVGVAPHKINLGNRELKMCDHNHTGQCTSVILTSKKGGRGIRNSNSSSTT